jgi:hypothetical protein
MFHSTFDMSYSVHIIINFMTQLQLASNICTIFCFLPRYVNDLYVEEDSWGSCQKQVILLGFLQTHPR